MKFLIMSTILLAFLFFLTVETKSILLGIANVERIQTKYNKLQGL